MRTAAALLLCALAAAPAGAQEDLWGGPRTRLDRVLDRAAANFVAGTQACTKAAESRIYEARDARFRRIARQATALLGREPWLTLISGSREPYDRPRFTRSVAQFALHLERAAWMIRHRETD